MLSIIIAIGVQALQPAFAPVPAQAPASDPALSVTEETIRFEAPGATYDAFHDNIGDYGPGGRLSALDFHYRLNIRSPEMDGSCGRVEPQVALDLTYHLPRWTQSERASLREQDAFDALYEREQGVLEDQAQSVRRALVWMIEDLRSLEAQDCEALSDSVTAVSQVWRDVIEQAMAPQDGGVRVVALRDEVCRRTGAVLARCRDD